MANITFNGLPKNESTWLAEAKKCQISNPKTASIFDPNYQMASGSKLGNTQFILLRQVWKERISAFRNINISNADRFLDPDYIEKAKSQLQKDKTWNAYLKWMEDTPNKLPIGPKAGGIGQFGLVLQSQQYTNGIDDRNENDKVKFSPRVTRSQTQTSRLPPIPVTPTRVNLNQPTLDISPDDLDIEDAMDIENDDDNSPVVSSVDQHSPMAGEAARQEIKIISEQEVVLAQVALHRSLCNLMDELTNVSWHPHQIEFEVKNTTNDVIFSAIVDGVMRVRSTKHIPAFIETKRGFRYANKIGAPVKAQESCQMAAKVAQYPPRNFQEMRAKNLKAREIWFSQDKNEVYINVGEFDADYVDYITDKQPVRFSLAEIQEYGPYPTTDWKYMRELGIVCLAFALETTGAH